MEKVDSASPAEDVTTSNTESDGTEVVISDDAESEENLTATTEIGSINGTDTNETEAAPVVEPIQLPPLFEPTPRQPTAIPATAKSYMKMADAYLDKGKYALAAKQFLKVIKKAPDHLPAHLGYATAVERTGKSKQINTAALAYGNATKVAIIQGERVDPLTRSGAGGIAENILKRAVQLAKSAPSGRLETLQLLSKYAHTSALAADIYFEIGMDISKQGIDQGDNKDDAIKAFSIANEFIVRRNDTDIPYHIGSIIQLCKIALEHEGDGQKVIDKFNEVKDVHMPDDLHVGLLVLVGRAHVSLGALEVAVTEFTRAISFPECSSTPSAHHELAIALKKNGGDPHEINLHFEKALDLGMDPTQEAVEALGERSMPLMRALNRQYYKNYNSGGAERTGGGGIMSGGGVGSQSTSVFAPQPKQNEQASSQSETLTLLEQGASSYDGHTPMGGEVEGTESSLSNLKVKKQQGSESNLQNLRR